MSVATLTVNKIGRAGINITTSDLVAATAGGDLWANTGAEFLIVNNAGVGAVTVTLAIQATVDGQAPANRTVTVPNGDIMLIGPFPPNSYNDASSNAKITYSGVTSVTVGAFALGS